MIAQPHFSVEPWAVTEEELDLGLLAQAESVLALSNGHIGLRANLDEGEPYGMPGTYLNAFYEVRPLPYAEAGYGYPEDGQTVLNVTNGKLIRLLVDDEPFDLRYGTLVAHRRTLDLRAGVLRREVHWRSPAGREIKVRSVRLVSFVHRSVAAIRYEVAPLDGETRIVVQSELVANEDVPVRSADPRAAAILRAPLVPEWHGTHELRAVLVHRTRQSALRMAAGMDHMVEGPQGTVTENESFDDIARVTVSAEVGHGETLTLTKYLAYGWSSQRSMVSIRDQADAALASARRTGFDGLLDDQREYLDDFWERADVEIDGDDELQQAVRFALFHTLQSAARAETRAIAAKGLTGDGYDGHVFWDTESFVLPVLTYTAPETVRDALAWRHSTLDLATERARQLRLDGATFPWRTIRGHECSAYWPAGTAAFHVNADIADAVLRYLQRDRRRRVRARAGARAAGRDRAAVALAGPPRRARRVPRRGGHRARRVLGDRRRQRLHEPHGRPEPGRRGGVAASAIARRRRRSGSARRRWPPGATRPPRSPCPTTTSSGSMSSRRATRATSAGTSRRRRPTSTRCCCTSPTTTSTASRSSSRPTSCSR